MKKEKAGKESKKVDSYTVTEVGALLENIDKNVRQIAEGHAGLDQRLEKVEVAVHGNSRRIDMVELRLGVVDGKATRLEDAVSKLSKDLRETREEFSKDLKETRQELGSKIDHLDQRLGMVESNR